MSSARIRNAASVVALGVGLLIGTSPAGAQTLTWEDRGFLNVNVGMQPGSGTFTETSTPVINGENASFVVPFAIGASPLGDVSAGLRVWENFGFAAGYSRFTKHSASTLNAQIPNPILTDHPRSATAPVNDLAHTESAVHLQMLWMLPFSSRFDVAAILGASFFTVTQDLVSGVTATEGAPPFTAVSIASAQTTSGSKTAPALTVGGDATYRLTRQWGAGIFARYSRLSGGLVKIADPSGSGDVSVSAGGAQIGLGLRARF